MTDPFKGYKPSFNVYPQLNNDPLFQSLFVHAMNDSFQEYTPSVFYPEMKKKPLFRSLFICDLFQSYKPSVFYSKMNNNPLFQSLFIYDLF